MKTMGKTLVCILALLVTLAGLSALTVSAEEHSLEDCRQQFCDELLAEFYAKAGSQNKLKNDGILAGVYADSASKLHIAVTDADSRDAYANLFTDEVLTALAEKQLAQTHCGHTVADLTKDAIVFEVNAYSSDWLRAAQSALTPHFDDLGIYLTSVLEDENCLEIRTEDEKYREGIVRWMAQNVDGFGEDAIRIVVEPNTIEFDVAYFRAPYRIALLVGAAVLVVAILAVVLLVRRRKKRN